MAQLSNKTKGFGLGAIVLASPMVAYYEGVVHHSYQDVVGTPTVCIGETDKSVVTLKQSFTNEECEALLGASLQKHMDQVEKCVTAPVKPNEAAAIVSWSYNIGPGAACGSTLVKKLNAGAPASNWCPEMRKWVYAGGKQLDGLVKRRDAEVKMCLTGEWK